MRRLVSKNSLKGLYDRTVKKAWATMLNSWGVSPDECNRKLYLGSVITPCYTLQRIPGYRGGRY